MAVMLLAWLCVAEPLSNRAGNSRAKDDEERAVKIDAASSALAQAWNTQAQAIPQQAQVAAASVQDERPYDLSVHVDAGPDMTQYLNQISDDSRRLNATFDTLATRYAAAKDNALALRPDIGDLDFDFISTDDGLQVVSDSMNRQDREWLQQQLNADPALVSAAHDFNALVVKRYDTDQDRVDTSGQVYTHTSFHKGLHTSYDYRGLADTVDRSVKFVALMHDAQAEAKTMNAQYADATGYKPQDYAKAADLVQRYLEANITEYGEIAADGSISVSHRTGSIVSDWL
jgi:hypothetical protein